MQLADDATVLEFEDPVCHDSAATREVAGDRRGDALGAWDQILTLALTPAPAQCSNMPLNISLPCRMRALGGLSRSIWTSSTSSAYRSSRASMSHSS